MILITYKKNVRIVKILSGEIHDALSTLPGMLSATAAGLRSSTNSVSTIHKTKQCTMVRFIHFFSIVIPGAPGFVNRGGEGVLIKGRVIVAIWRAGGYHLLQRYKIRVREID